MWKGNLGKALLTHKIANTIFGPTLGTFLITATMTVTTAIALHFITITDGTVQEGDKSNVPYVTEENMKNSSISNDGKVNTEYNAQEIWDGLIQNNSRISQYLDGPNELKKLMNAELITKYLDTRPDPNEPIDWNSINSNPNSTEVQGIIKLKRAMEEDKVETMVYADMGTLQGYIDLYNDTGSDEAKEAALTHFSIGEGNNAIIAIWEKTEDILESDDPDVITYDIHTYNMTTTTIDYQSMVKGYTMPFEFLWSLVLVGQEKEFALDLADLVYNSEIEIAILDSVRTNTNIETETYTKKTKVHTHDVSVSIETEPINKNQTTETNKYYSVTNIDAGTDTATNNYTTVHTVITETNTINAIVSYADIWALKYSNQFSVSTPEPEETESNKEKPDRPFPDTPDKSDSIDAMGLAAKKASSLASGYKKPNVTVSASVTSLTSDYFFAKENIKINIRNIVEDTNNLPGPGFVKEKVDSNSIEPNFVTLFIDDANRKSSLNINSATEWLFELLAQHEETSDMMDLVKYLLGKATSKDYGVESFDYQLFGLDEFKLIGGDSNSFNDELFGKFLLSTSGIEGVQGKIFDYLLARGVPAAGIAAILGNLQEDVDNGSMSWEKVYENIDEKWQDMKRDNPEVIDALMNAKEEDIEYAVWKYLQSQGGIIGNNFDECKEEIKQQVENAQKWYNEYVQNNPYKAIENAINILNFAQSTAEEMIEKDVSYSRNGLEYNSAKKNADYDIMKVQDCGGFVASVLYNSGAVSLEEWGYIEEKHKPFHDPDGLVTTLTEFLDWDRVSLDNIMPGDIVTNGGHVVIYAGNDTYWDVYAGTRDTDEAKVTTGFSQFIRDAVKPEFVRIARQPKK